MLLASSAPLLPTAPASLVSAEAGVSPYPGGGFKPLITQRWWEGTRDLQLAASLLRAHESRTHSSTHRFPPPDSDILTETFALICWHLSNHGSPPPTHPPTPSGQGHIHLQTEEGLAETGLNRCKRCHFSVVGKKLRTLGPATLIFLFRFCEPVLLFQEGPLRLPQSRVQRARPSQRRSQPPADPTTASHAAQQQPARLPGQAAAAAASRSEAGRAPVAHRGLQRAAT